MSVLLDLAALERLRAMGRKSGTDLLGEILDIFARETPARLLRLAEAERRGDFSTLEREAHALRGNAGSLGALLLQEQCGALEAAAQQRQISLLHGLVDGVLGTAQRVLAALDEQRKLWDQGA